jgi:hypothetical protein
MLDNGQIESGFEKLAFFNDISARYYLEQRFKVVVLKLLMLPDWLTPILDVFTNIHLKPISRDELADFLRNLAVMQRKN